MGTGILGEQSYPARQDPTLNYVPTDEETYAVLRAITKVDGGDTTMVTSPSTGARVPPNTGGLSAVTLGLVSALLVGGLLAYHSIR